MTTNLTKMFLFCCLIMSAAALQCMDEENNPVDWFAVYKIPTIKHRNNLISTGVAYTYITSKNTWKLSDLSINNSNSIIANTLKSLYGKDEKNVMYLLYNDQPPNSNAKARRGHTKGVVLVNSQGGLWLIHSVPRFPDISGRHYVYPESGSIYGQNFLCISLNMENINKVGLQLQYNQAAIYEQNILTKLPLPELVNAAKHTVIRKSSHHVSSIISKKGVEFTSFAKSKKYNRDLYEDLVAPFLKSDLLVETWTNVGVKLESNCKSTYKVNNVESISLDAVNVSFTSTRDHSKWAVSVINKKKWLCIGDINRTESQKKRGGGTVCFNNQRAANDYEESIKDVETCKRKFH